MYVCVCVCGFVYANNYVIYTESLADLQRFYLIMLIIDWFVCNNWQTFLY